MPSLARSRFWGGGSSVTEALLFEPALIESCDHFPTPDERKKQVIASRATKTKSRTELRRAKSEAHLLEIMPAPLDTLSAYHVISGGDVDSLSFLGRVVKEGPLDYALMSTWCMALPDVEQLAAWLESGRIGRMDAYAGEIFPNQYPDVYRRLCDVMRAHGGRVAIFRNHAKVYAGTGPAFDFAISSSANVNTNPRTENTVLTFGAEIFGFYKAFFDGINSFTRDFDDWTPWSEHDTVTGLSSSLNASTSGSDGYLVDPLLVEDRSDFSNLQRAERRRGSVDE